MSTKSQRCAVGQREKMRHWRHWNLMTVLSRPLQQGLQNFFKNFFSYSGFTPQLHPLSSSGISGDSVCVCVCIHRRPLPSRPEAETQWNTAWSRTAAVPPGSPSPPHLVASSACDSWRCGYFSGWIPATTARRSLDKGRRRHKGKEERWGGFGFRPLPWLSLFSLIL